MNCHTAQNGGDFQRGYDANLAGMEFSEGTAGSDTADWMMTCPYRKLIC
jgi:hypothetical protein